MSEPTIVTLEEVEADRTSFIELVRGRGNVYIKGSTGLYVVAHRINSACDVEPITNAFYDCGLSPWPVQGPIGHVSSVVFWEGRYVDAPGLRVNILGFQRFASELLILTDGGRAVMVLQNLVPDAKQILASLSETELQQLLP